MSVSKPLVIGALATAGAGIAWISARLLQAKRESGTQWFSGADVLRAVLFSARSTALRNILLASVVLTYGFTKATQRRFRWRRVFFVFFSTILALYYRFGVVETPVVRCRRTFWNMQLVEKAGLAHEAFRPTFWAFNRHMMTVCCSVLSHVEFLWMDPIKYRREELTARDGNPIYLDWAEFHPDSAAAPVAVDWPVVVLLHGLAGGRDEAYVKRLSLLCHKRGWRPVVFSFWRLDFAQCDDLRIAIQHIQQQFPSAPIAAVAFSAGGHILMRYLEACGRDTPLVAAVSVSGCLDFVGTYGMVQQQENITYKMFLDYSIKRCAWRHLEHDKSPLLQRDAVARIVREEAAADRLYDRIIHQLPSLTGRALLASGAARSGAGAADATPLTHSDAVSPGMAVGLDIAAGAEEAGEDGALDPRRGSGAGSDVGCDARDDASGGESDAARSRGDTDASDTTTASASVAAAAAAPPAAVAAAAAARTMSAFEPAAAVGEGDGVFGGHVDMLAGKSLAEWVFRQQTAGHYQLAAGQHLDRVGVTFLMLHAADDPIVINSSVNWDEVARRNKNIISVTTRRGGHIGWHESSVLSGPTWADRVAVRFLSAVLETHAQTNFLASVMRQVLGRGEEGELSASQLARICSSSDVASALPPGTEAVLGTR